MRILLFDGDCVICNQFALFARRLDCKRQFEILPYQSYESLAAYGITEEACAKAIHLLNTETGHIRRGAFAMNAFFIRFFPFNLLVLLCYVVPVFLLAEIIVYAVVAKNRQKISRLLGLDACKLSY